MRKVLAKLTIPVLLIALWIFLTVYYIFNNSFSLSVISYSHSKNNFVNFSTYRIFAGHKVTGEFNAQENYLGIVTVSFATFNQVSYADEDTLLFRIKEAGAKQWYYQNTYRSGLIYEVPIYPFGFPRVVNSKGKNYVFEIESLNGSNLNAVALNSWEPVLVTRYQIPKTELLKSKINLAEFFLRRFLVSFGDRGVIFFSFVYFLPFLFYLILYFSPIKKIIESILIRFRKKTTLFVNAHPVLRPFADIYSILKNKIIGNLDSVVFIVVIVNIFFVPIINDLALIVVAALWLYLAKIYKNTSRRSFLVGIFLILLCPVILYFRFEDITKKSAVWAFMFLVAGTIQALLELKTANKVNEKA